MRKEALVLSLLLGAVGVGLAEEPPLGKPVRWEPVGVESKKVITAESLETPNQRRRRLGIKIEAAAPAEYGEATETPNQRRKRLAAAKAVVQAK